MSKFDREWSEYKSGIAVALRPGSPRLGIRLRWLLGALKSRFSI